MIVVRRVLISVIAIFVTSAIAVIMMRPGMPMRVTLHERRQAQPVRNVDESRFRLLGAAASGISFLSNAIDRFSEEPDADRNLLLA